MGPLFVQVAVENTVYHFDRLFTYALPAELEQVVVPGMRVMAPFGTANKERVAMVFSIGSTGAPGVKPVLAALDREAVVSPEMLELEETIISSTRFLTRYISNFERFT